MTAGTGISDQEGRTDEAELPEDEFFMDEESLEDDPAQGLFVTSKHSIPLTPGLSEEELKELLGPLKEPKPVMAELSKEELEELLAPPARYELTDEGPLPDPDEDDADVEFISSVLSEVSEDDDPEIQALARQIAELERQEQAEKGKKKSKKKQKRKR